MFTDMVGYTALTQSDEAQAMEVVERHNRLLRPFFPRFHGREIKTIGDSFLVEFGSALDAVRCAVEIQSFLHDYNASSRDEWKIRLRIGVHLGDVTEKGGDILGDAVNIASRIEPLAEAEGVCLSDQVFGQVENKVQNTLVKLGPRALKNVRLPVDTYKVVMPWEEQVSYEERFSEKRVAVLPFVSLSPDPNDEYFADGLTEELITRISLVEGLEVIARTSAMNYKKEKKNASQIGRELKVGTLLEGSVRKAGNRIRVSAQLINANTEGHLWAENYDRDLDDVFEVQTLVAQNVAGALKLKLLGGEEGRLEQPGDLEAYTIYLRATQLSHEGNEESLREAVSLFQKAVSRNPSFVRAHAGLAMAQRMMSRFGDYTSTVAKAEASARRALELGPEFAESHAAMAHVHMALDRFEEARHEIERAIQINPNLAEGYALLGSLHYTFGRFEEGRACYRKARDLDPLSLLVELESSEALRVEGKVDEAIEVLSTLRELHPSNPHVYVHLALCYAQMKDFSKAAESLGIGIGIDPEHHDLRVVRGGMFAILGKRKEAEEELSGLLKDEEDETLRADAQLVIQTLLGNYDEAFDALAHQAEIHAWPGLIRFDPFFGGLRADPRFSEFCKKVGLPP